MTHLVKRKGHIEEFDERKIYASVFASCMVLRMTDEESEVIADMVTHEVLDALKKEKDIQAHKIHEEVVKTLRKYNPDVAYMYDTHKDIY